MQRPVLRRLDDHAGESEGQPPINLAARTAAPITSVLVAALLMGCSVWLKRQACLVVGLGMLIQVGLSYAHHGPGFLGSGTELGLELESG